MTRRSMVLHFISSAFFTFVLIFPVLASTQTNHQADIIVQLREAAEQGSAKARFSLAKAYVRRGLTPKTEQEAARWLRKIIIDEQEEFMFQAMMLLGKMHEMMRKEYPNVSEALLKRSHGSLGAAIAEIGDYDAAIIVAIREALLLNAPAQIWLEISYISDANIRKYDPRILEYYREMASEKLPRAMLFMGKILVDGWGVPKNGREAAKWYRLAAEYGFADAQYDLGIIYSNGLDVPKDNKEAFKWYNLAAEQGMAISQVNLGRMYEYGHGVQQDLEMAEKWYRKAADQGEETGQYNLALMYHSGRGLPQDDVQAFNWYHKAAEQGFAKAEFSLGYAYTHGEGTKQDYGQALVWYKRASKHGNSDAMNNLSLAYAKGRGVEPDQSEVFRLAKLAAELGNIDAQRKMLIFNMSGIGVQKDLGKALAWGFMVQKRKHEEKIEYLVSRLSKILREKNPDQYRAAIKLSADLYSQYREPYENIAENSNCLPSESNVSLTGFLSRETFPGRPNYKSIEEGDEPETGYYLHLSSSICAEGVNHETEKTYPVNGIKLLQLNVVHSQHWAAIKKLHDRKVRVIVTGKPYIGVTGHYHAPHGAAISVENVRVVDK